MSQILKGFVDALNQIHKGDLEALGVTTDGHTPRVGWEGLPSPTFPGGPDGERIFATNLSHLGIGWDQEKRVLYFPVECSAENLVAEQGKAARTKTALGRGRSYKGIILKRKIGNREYLVLTSESAIAKLVESFCNEGPWPSLVGPFTNWEPHTLRIIPKPIRGLKPQCWTVHTVPSMDTVEGTVAKIAIPMPLNWRVVWNSGHHRPGIIQELRLWPPSSNG